MLALKLFGIDNFMTNSVQLCDLSGLNLNLEESSIVGYKGLVKIENTNLFVQKFSSYLNHQVLH